MASTLNTYVTSTVTLVNGTPTGPYSYSVPLTIAAGAGVKVAAYTGQSGTGFDGVYDSASVTTPGYNVLTNSGHIVAGYSKYTNGGIGVHITVAASVTNAGGYISGGDSGSGVGGIGVTTAGGNVSNTVVTTTTGAYTAGVYGEIYGGDSVTANGGIGVTTAAGNVTNAGGQIYGGDSTSANGGIGVTTTTGSVVNTSITITTNTTTKATNTYYGLINGGSSTNGTGGIGVSTTGMGAVTNTAAIIYGGDSKYGTGGIGILTAGGNVTDSSTGKAGSGTTPSTLVYGVISGGKSQYGTGGIGIDMTAGGTIKNSGTSYIAGGETYSVTGGSGGIGIDMVAGGTITNSGSAHVTGGDSFAAGAVGGIGVVMTGGSITNSGYVEGGYGQVAGAIGGVAVVMNGGSITNSGYIEGGYANYAGAIGGTGLVENGKATVTNTGKIFGGAGYKGDVDGVGVILNNGSTLTNSATIGSGYYVIYSGSGATAKKNLIYDTIAAKVYTGGTLTNSGKVYGGAIGVDIFGGTVINSGKITSYKTTSLTTTPHATAVNFGSVSGGKLETDIATTKNHNTTVSSITGNITGFAAGDTVQIANYSVAQVTANFNTTTDTLTDSGNTVVFVPTYAGERFVFTTDSTGGTDITSAPCYRVGTKIRTENGESLIEQLAIGDELMTASGVVRPIRWIGQIRYSQFFAAGNRDVLPIKICAGALAHDVPVRDLWVSPDHAMLVDGMLIPARSLVNGLTIWQDETPQDVTYIHVEFETHDLIYAEGAASETYVDEDTRAMFDNADDYKLRYPGALSVAPVLCAPRVEEGYQVEMVSDKLKARAEQMLGLPESSILAGNASRLRGNAAACSGFST